LWEYDLVTHPGPPPRPDLTPRKRSDGGRRLVPLAGGVAVVAVVAVVVAALLIPKLKDDKTTGTPKSANPAAAASAGAPAALTVLAHQGGFETYPHETLIALTAAAKSGAVAETDVQFTSDGVAILVHDDKTTAADKAGPENPMVCAGGPYTVSKTSWTVLRTKCRTLPSASKDGKSYGIPTYDETMKAIAAIPGAQIFPEVKVEHQSAKEIKKYLDTIVKYGMADRTVVSSFFPDALAQVQAAATKDHLTLRYLLMVRAATTGALPTPAEVSRQGMWGVALRSDIANAGNVAALHAKNLKVVEWTINGSRAWSAAKRAGVDYVLTDEPDAYRKQFG
jgi:glycerophosphoryl diester phosphodiesterase